MFVGSLGMLKLDILFWELVTIGWVLASNDGGVDGNIGYNGDILCDGGDGRADNIGYKEMSFTVVELWEIIATRDDNSQASIEEIPRWVVFVVAWLGKFSCEMADRVLLSTYRAWFTTWRRNKG